QTNQTVHMIMPSKDNLYNGRKGIGFENLSYLEKAKDLRPTLYDEKVIGPGYTPMFLTHSDEALEIKMFKRSRENKIDSPFQQTSSLKPYVPNVILEKIIIDLEDEVVNLLKKEKVNLETIESLKSKGVESSENSSKVIAPEMFKLNVSQYVSPISMSKTSCDSNNVEIKLKRKRHLDTFSSVRRPKNSDIICKKKSVSNLNKNVKRYSRKDLLACNNSHLGETRSDFMCNDAMNVSFNPRLCDVLDDNNFFIFDDENVRISPVSKMPFRKKPRDSMNVRSKSNSNKSLPRTVHKWLPKLQPLAEPIAKWFLRVKRQIVQRVRTDNGTEFKNKTLAKFFNEDVGKLKAKGDIRVFVGYSKESAFLRIYNKRTRKIHESVNVNFDDILEMAFKQFSLELGLSNLNETGKSSNLSVLKVDEASKNDLEDLFQDFYDEYFDSSKIMKS
nr:hypothetical protein [Tanacetum cinerariifolium]